MILHIAEWQLCTVLEAQTKHSLLEVVEMNIFISEITEHNKRMRENANRSRA